MTSRILDYVPQPDAATCQSACIAMMVGSEDVDGIRASLLEIGEPGNPYVMAEYLTPNVKEYQFSDRASIADMVRWLGEGYRLITHGYFSHSGHVVVLSGHKNDCFFVDDPYGEFNALAWAYTDNQNGDDLPYSERLIFAACVMAHNVGEAIACYGRSTPDRQFGNAWVHRIKN